MVLSILFASVLAASSPTISAARSAPPFGSPAADVNAEKPDGKSAPDAMTPEIRQAVDAMQHFYESTERFEADFTQIYSYTTFARETKSTGHLRFHKGAASLRWDYRTPNEKSFVVAADKFFAYDKEAKQILVADMDSDRISASVSFLWGKGRLDREFIIRPSARDDLKDGIALELTPKVSDPRFKKVYFLIDRKDFSVRETLVIDPDGSENHVIFGKFTTDGKFGREAFLLSPPPDVQVIRFDQQKPASSGKSADKDRK